MDQQTEEYLCEAMKLALIIVHVATIRSENINHCMSNNTDSINHTCLGMIVSMGIFGSGVDLYLCI